MSESSRRAAAFVGALEAEQVCASSTGIDRKEIENELA